MRRSGKQLEAAVDSQQSGSRRARLVGSYCHTAETSCVLSHLLCTAVHCCTHTAHRLCTQQQQQHTATATHTLQAAQLSRRTAATMPHLILPTATAADDTIRSLPPPTAIHYVTPLSIHLHTNSGHKPHRPAQLAESHPATCVLRRHPLIHRALSLSPHCEWLGATLLLGDATSL